MSTNASNFIDFRPEMGTEYHDWEIITRFISPRAKVGRFRREKFTPADFERPEDQFREVMRCIAYCTLREMCYVVICDGKIVDNL